MKSQVSTRDYEFSHGKKPRGFGSWAFAFDGKDDVGSVWWAPAPSTYTAAVKAARAEARKRNARDVEVCS